MADRRRRARLRTGLGWVLTLAIAAYTVIDWGDRDDDRIEASAGDGDGDAKLRIIMISDAEVSPGDAVVVRFDNADDDLPIGARLAGDAAAIVDRRAHSLVVRIPDDMPTGRAPLRLVQGSRKSKTWDLLVRPPRHGKLLARVIGGLALFFYGFGVLAAGFRGLAGRRLRSQLGRLTEAPSRAVGVGVAVGAATQLTTTSTAVTVGLIEARLLALGPAIAILVGAQLGAALIGALLPLGFARESLEIVAIGVVWSFVANTRRGRAIGSAILGVGLVLYGLRLLQSGIDPLLADPKLLPYIGYLQSSGAGPLALAVVVGIVGGLVLQGPGPVYGLALGLAQVSGALSLANLLAILAGTNLGAAIGMAIIASSSGGTRALVRPQLAFGAMATALGLALIPVLVPLADALVPGDPAHLDYRHDVMLPQLSSHLAVGFAIMQLAVTGAWALAVLPRLVSATAATRRTPRAAPEPTQPELSATFARHRATLDACLAATTSGERGHGELEGGLAEARQAVEDQFAALATAESAPIIDRLRRVVLGTLQLQRSIEHLVHVTELGVERGLSLTTDEQTRVVRLHDLAAASLAALAAAADGASLDIEAARGREIEMNLIEDESRTQPLAPGATRRRNESTSIRLGLAELIDAYEHVGNHLFRVAKALAEEDDDDE